MTNAAIRDDPESFIFYRYIAIFGQLEIHLEPLRFAANL